MPWLHVLQLFKTHAEGEQGGGFAAYLISPLVGCLARLRLHISLMLHAFSAAHLCSECIHSRRENRQVTLELTCESGELAMLRNLLHKHLLFDKMCWPQLQQLSAEVIHSRSQLPGSLVALQAFQSYCARQPERPELGLQLLQLLCSEHCCACAHAATATRSVACWRQPPQTHHPGAACGLPTIRGTLTVTVAVTNL